MNLKQTKEVDNNKQQFELSSLLDNTSDMIQSVDAEGMIIYANKAWLETLEYNREEVEGLEVMEVIHPDSHMHCMRMMEELNHGKSFEGGEVILLSKSGDKIFTNATINCIYNSVGDPIGSQAFFRNVTEERHASETARASEHKFKLLVESANDIIYSCNPRGIIDYVNQQGADFFESSTSEITGTHFGAFVREDYKQKTMDFYLSQFRNRIESTYNEFPVVTKNGVGKWIGQTIRVIADQENKDGIKGFIGVMRDISSRREEESRLIASKDLLETSVSQRTEELEKANKELNTEIDQRIRIEQKLQLIKKEYEHLFHSTLAAIMVFRASDEVVLEVNKKSCEMYGFTVKEFVGMSLEDITPDIPAGKELISKTIAAEGKIQLRTHHFNKRGEKMLLEVNATPIVYRNQQAILTINRDITQSNRLQLELEAERRQKLNALIDGQELERKRIAKELHDGIGQMLTSLTQTLRRVDQKDKLSSTHLKVLEDAEKLANDTIEEVRRIAKNLMPSILMDFGLESALRSMVELVNGGISVRFVCPAEIGRFSIRTEIGIYRIVQEAVTNAIRHAKASSIEVVATDDAQNLSIAIIDNGTGFKNSNGRVIEGNGISNMKERARLMEAAFEIQSSKENGTKILITHSKA